MVHFQYFHNDTAEPPTPAITLLFVIVESQSIYDSSSSWVLTLSLQVMPYGIIDFNQS